MSSPRPPSADDTTEAQQAILLLMEGLSCIVIEKRNEVLEPNSMLYLEHSVQNFKYAPRGVSYLSEMSPIERVEWSQASRERFFEQVARSHVNYDGAIATLTASEDSIAKILLAASGEIHEVGAAELAVKRLVDTVIGDLLTPENGASPSEYVDAFFGDLDEKAIAWSADIWLEGLDLFDNRYELSDQLILRRPDPIDFETEYRPDLFDDRHPLPSGVQNPSAILSLTCSAPWAESLERECDRIIDVLRLLDVGSVRYVKRVIRPTERTVLRQTTFDVGKRFPRGFHHYAFSEAHAVAFPRLSKAIGSLLPTGSAAGQTERACGVSVAIALDRYHDALFRAESIAAQTAQAVSCLEALYGSDRGPGSGIRHTFSQRAAYVLGASTHFQAVRVFADLREAYDVRSAHFHGDEPSGRLRRRIAKRRASLRGDEGVDRRDDRGIQLLCRDVLDYARLSLVLFLQILSVHGQSKVETLRQIDEAMIGSAQDSIKSLLSSIYLPNPSRESSEQDVVGG